VRGIPRARSDDWELTCVHCEQAVRETVGKFPVVEEITEIHGLMGLVCFIAQDLAARDTRGLIKLVAEDGSSRVVGAHITAPEAGEMIMEPTLAVRFGLTIEDLVSTLHPYLTLAEGIKLCAQTFDKDVMMLSCCAG
jgi:hypothetical protein